MSETQTSPPIPALWHEPAPRHFDLAVPWWIKALLLAAATVLAMLFLDQPLALWAQAHPIPDLTKDLTANRGDLGREMMWLEQFGQFVCTASAVFAIALLDPQGRRRALSIALACALTMILTHLLKDLCGRTRPFNTNVIGASDGHSEWRGWWWGFNKGSAFGSFPSAHTTAAFALASSLAWFYPRGRYLFMTLALITAAQRVLHCAHYLSDVLAAMGIGVFIARITLQWKLAGRYVALMPDWSQAWWAGDKNWRRLWGRRTPPA